MWLAPTLFWGFQFQFAEVARERGRAAPELVIDWVRLAVPSWQDMAGGHASCGVFAQPIEASISFFAHHRYNRVDLRIARQRGRLLQVVAEVEDDLDDLGIAALRVSSRLLFGGITVALSSPPQDVDTARVVLEEFTATDGLEGYQRADDFWFTTPI